MEHQGMLTENFKRERSQWFHADSSEPAGVVLLAHGLNQRPSSWTELTEYLNSLDLHVYRLALQGHRGLAFSDMHTVNADIWEKELIDGYAQIKKCFPDIPIYLVAYSLGSLLAMSVQLKVGKRLFDRQVLLAPALAIKPYTRLALAICKLFPFLPSRSPREYLANRKGITAEAYRALFQLEKDLQMFEDFATINIPTRVMMRPEDELISYRATARFMEVHNLDRWRIVPLVDKTCAICPLCYRHLIVDRNSAGGAIWSQMTREMSSFLAGDAAQVAEPVRDGC